MKSTKANLGIRPKNSIIVILVTVLVLAIPFVAMQFTDEVKWDVHDFVVIGGLLVVSGLVFEFIASGLKTKKQRVMLALTFLVIIFVVWVELAVGIFD